MSYMAVDSAALPEQGDDDFDTVSEQVTGSKHLHAAGIDVLQINVGLTCDLACVHCHLACSPKRTETMDWPTMERVIEIGERADIKLADITGGAPELNPNFRRLVKALRSRNREVQVRTNLTVLLKPGMEDMPEFYRDHEVQLAASLPCYIEENVRAQRGLHVYNESIEVIRRLNAVGYGKDPRLALDLVYNPGGPVLPPSQKSLEANYRQILGERFGLYFSELLTITNMPIGRFKDTLRRKGQDQIYMTMLRDSFNGATIDGLMCRHQINIGWDGTIYDCDFNQALSLPVAHGTPDHVNRIDLATFPTRRIVTGEHCFGCTAGTGSSCGGALAE
jgi:radical SAM/Cys-rich protein